MDNHQNSNLFSGQNDINTSLGIDVGAVIHDPENNLIALVLKVLGWLTITCGFILGLVLAGQNDPILTDIPTWTIFLPYWIGGAIAGLFMLGFSEIVKLLHQINLKLGKANYELDKKD